MQEKSLLPALSAEKICNQKLYVHPIAFLQFPNRRKFSIAHFPKKIPCKDDRICFHFLLLNKSRCCKLKLRRVLKKEADHVKFFVDASCNDLRFLRSSAQ